ncbi:centromere/kinetochore protein zw10 [Holotrichia oblita]|uniref:Centromere/kinetochore protein zw10 n=1 Tax=Holotrichia oblita TaxID=644536 RepID=A0ACB9T778_HOLOL|nr:centromere/kinetochore protein zw10 [Holotrichia oblita]
MSFVAEILCSAEKIAIENMDKNVAHILYISDGYKQDVLQYIEEVYIKFSRKSRSNLKLLNKSNTLMTNILEIDKTLDEIITNEMNQASNMFVLYKQELNKAKQVVELGSKLIKIHELLLNINNCIRCKKYVDGIKLIKEIEECSDDLEIIQLDAFNGIINKFRISKDILIRELVREYRECIQYTTAKPFTLTINLSENIVEILNAVGICKSELIDELVEFLWNNMFSVIVNYKATVSVVEQNKIKKIIVDVNDEKLNDNYNNVFENVILLINFLNNHFRYILDIDTTLDYIGKQIRINLSELIINCLMNTIPTNSEELEKYTTAVVKDVEDLQLELIKCKIFTEDTDLIINYVKSIDVFSIHKRCAEYICRAREIMKKDLNDMVEIGTELDKTNLLSSSNTFPTCFISKSTLELIDLSEEIRKDATSLEANAEELYSTIRNIFHIYGSVVEHHHQKLLQTTPKQVALFYNNCIYLSVFLLPTLFVQESYLLKRTGIRTLVGSIQQQINEIEDIIKISGLSSLNSKEKLDTITDKSIHQCLKQQELLQTAWHKILPDSEYNRSIGYILNYLCNCIINEILNKDEISSEVRDQLVDIVKDILIRGPKLFTNPKDVRVYVKVWDRFNELVFILNLNLNEVCDRWADGNGPLALQFKPEEIQRLISILYQNSDMAAAVLAKIIK